MTFDATRFPLAAQYIKSLPRGLDSHPECQVRADVVEPHIRELSRIASLTGLPKPLEAFVSGPPAGQKWVSEVVFQAANLVLRDAGFPTETGFLQWSYDISAELFDKPLVRT